MSRPPDNLAIDNLGFFAALALAALARVLVFLSIVVLSLVAGRR
jgi:hypothetical protein